MAKEKKIKTIKAMGDEYITHKQAMAIFNKLPDAEKIKILTKALIEKCDIKDHAEYMIIKQIKGIAYSDMWGDDKNGFLYKLYK